MLQIILDTRSNQAPVMVDLLADAGAAAVTLQDGAEEPIYEPPLGTTPLWSYTRVTALFEIGSDMQTVLTRLRETLGPADNFAYRIEAVEDQDWQRVNQNHFHPLRFGERLWVCPHWHALPDPNAVNLLLDPGLAFGTGSHPTTALCLEWLAAADLQALRVIDYGCGSGILGIAAAKLGASQVWAVDNDPQALQATRDNAAKNGLQEHISALTPEALPEAEVDLLIANILARPLIDLAAHFARRVRPGGYIVLSGILSSQVAEVMQAYNTWFTLAQTDQREDWICLEATRKSDKV